MRTPQSGGREKFPKGNEKRIYEENMCLVCACFAFGLGFARRLRAELRPELKTDSMGPDRV